MTLALAFTIKHSKIWTIRHHSTKFKSHRKIHFSLNLLLLKNTTKQMKESHTLDREVTDSFQNVWILKTKKLMKCFWWTRPITLMMTLNQLINEASSISALRQHHKSSKRDARVTRRTSSLQYSIHKRSSRRSIASSHHWRAKLLIHSWNTIPEQTTWQSILQLSAMSQVNFSSSILRHRWLTETKRT